MLQPGLHSSHFPPLSRVPVAASPHSPGGVPRPWQVTHFLSPQRLNPAPRRASPSGSGDPSLAGSGRRRCAAPLRQQGAPEPAVPPLGALERDSLCSRDPRRRGGWVGGWGGRRRPERKEGGGGWPLTLLLPTLCLGRLQLSPMGKLETWGCSVP